MRLYVAAAVVFAATALFWAPSARYGLLLDDDPEYVIENGHVRGGLTLENASWAFNCGYAANWHPLAWLSLMADANAWRSECGTAVPARVVLAMHAHNVLLHAANAALLFLLMGMMVKKLGGSQSFLLLSAFAFLWAVHPLRCEVVCWISERKELSSVFFMLLALLFWVEMSGQRTEDKALRNLTGNQKPETGSQKLLYSLSLLAFALALMAKPVAVTLPLVLFAWDWIVRGCRLSRCMLRIFPFTVLSCAAAVLTIVAQARDGAMADTAFMPHAARISSALKAPVMYLLQTIFPTGLSSRYPLERDWQWGWVMAGGVLLTLLACSLVKWWRTRSQSWAVAAFGVIWCYGGLIPMLGIIKVGTQPHSDRYTYWVGCGLCVVVALFTKIAESRWPYSRVASARSRIPCFTIVAAIAAYGIAGIQRMEVWRDAETHLRDAYEKSGFFDMGSALAHHLLLTGREAEGEAVLRDAVSRAGEVRDVANGHLALYLAAKENLRERDIDEARLLARTALAADARCVKAHEALGLAAYREGKFGEARSHLEAAIASGARDGKAAELLKKIGQDVE